MSRLIEAVKENNFDLVKKLLLQEYQNNNLVNEERTKAGFSALHIAAYYGFTSILKLLLDSGADPNLPDANGTNALYIAAQKGHLEAVRILLAAGATNQLIEGGFTPLYIASQEGHPEIVKLLLETGAEVNQENQNGATPFFIAAQKGHTTILQILLKRGANPNQAKSDGATPLFAAVQNGHVDAVKILLSAGADIQAKFMNISPLEMAKKKNNLQVLAVLEQHEEKHLNLNNNASFESLEIRREEPLLNPQLEELKKEIAKTQYLLKMYSNNQKMEPEYIAQRVKFLDETLNYFLINPAALESDSFAYSLSALRSMQSELAGLIQDTVTLSQMLDFRVSQDPNISETSLDSLASSLINPIEGKHALDETDTHELNKEGERIQVILQQELDAKKIQCVSLEKEQLTLKDEIANLKNTVNQKTDNEQMHLQIELAKLQEQLLNNQTRLDILWSEYKIKEQKKEIIEKFQSHPNLILFYRTVNIKLEETFISFKAVAGGFVNPVDGNVSLIKSLFDTVADSISLAPVIGTAIEKFLKWTVSNGLGQIDSARQNNIAINASSLATLSEVKKYAESIARQLTERYAEQLQMLLTPEEEEAKSNLLKKATSKAQEKLLKKQYVSSVKQLAVYAVVCMVDVLYNAHKIEDKNLDMLLLAVFSPTPFTNKLEKVKEKVNEFWREISIKIGIEGIKTKKGEVWHPEAAFMLPGIRLKQGEHYEYYDGKKVEPKKYGWRLGTLDEIQRLKLSQVSAPHETGFILETQKANKSIKSVKRLTQQNADNLEQQKAVLEKLEKTGSIIEGARLKEMQNAFEEERLVRKQLEERIAKIEQEASKPIVFNPTTGTLRREKEGYAIFPKSSEEVAYLNSLVNETINKVFKTSGIYYHIDAGREISEKVLSQHLPGTFLVRPSSKNNGIVISYKDIKGQYVHGLLEKRGDKFIFGGSDIEMTLEQILIKNAREFNKPLPVSNVKSILRHQ